MPLPPNASHAEVNTVYSAVERIRERIATACRRAGRSEEEITLIAVSKTFPPFAVEAAIAAGVSDFGENRVQELTQKVAAVPGRRAGGDVRWHMIGHLQRNKAKDIVRMADFFHALDSQRLAQELNTKAEQEGVLLPCLVQVNTSGEASKEGVAPDQVDRLLDEIQGLANLRLIGFMTVAAFEEDAENVRPEFRMLREIRDRTAADRRELALVALSMGMSHDFEIAIEEGATHIRVGSAIFGERGR